MDYKQLGELRLDENGDVLFGSNRFFRNRSGIQIGITNVRRGEEMRIDKISLRIYDSIDYSEDLLLLNGIVMPYSIRAGQSIIYTPQDQLSLLRTRKSLSSEIREQIRRDVLGGGTGTQGLQGASTRISDNGNQIVLG